MVFVKLQHIPTGKRRHVKNPVTSRQRETHTGLFGFHGALEMVGGVCVYVCGCVLVCAEDFSAATQPGVLALFPTITQKLCPKF